MRKFAIQILIILLPFVLTAQGGHLSQPFQSPLFLNAALTGFSDGNFRLGGNYRSQWKSVNSPDENFNFYFDKNNEKFSYGLLLNQNNAGQEGIKITNVLLSFSFKKQLSEGANFLSFGAQAGLFQQRFDLTKMTFDNQYNPEKGYDSSLESGENFNKTSVLMPDFNVGINWRFSKQTTIPISGDLGISFSHINTPNSSFLNENIHLPLKSTIYGKLNLGIKPTFGIEPFFLFNKQGTAAEFLLGMNTIFQISNSKLKFGIANRVKDAFIFMAGVQFNNLELGFSYDTHFQEFNSQNNAGSMELSLTYLFGRKSSTQNSTIKKEPAPTNNQASELEEPVENDDDEDGIPNDLDSCPFEAGIAKYNGCNDRDEDGVWDNKDACPSLPGTLENYGCPLRKENIDSDGDGVLDQYDDCIYIQGPAFLKGCPDSDKDGVSDYEDACPYQKGEKETDGCPELNGGNTLEQISNDFIEFETNSSKIQSKYYPFLDRLAFQLLNNPELEIVIEGHTDHEGNHLYNYHLSQERARFVRNYFYEKQVPIERIKLHFYGETKPKVDRATDFAKARNRRVELIVFQAK